MSVAKIKVYLIKSNILKIIYVLKALKIQYVPIPKVVQYAQAYGRNEIENESY